MKVIKNKMSFWFLNKSTDLYLYNQALTNDKDLEYTDTEIQFYKFYFPYSIESWNKSISENKYDFKACICYRAENAKYLNYVELNKIILNNEFIDEILFLINFCIKFRTNIDGQKITAELRKHLIDINDLWKCRTDNSYVNILYDIFYLLVKKTDKKVSFLFLVLFLYYSGLSLINLENSDDQLFWLKKLNWLYINQVNVDYFKDLIINNIVLYHSNEQFIPNIYSNQIDFKKLKNKINEFICNIEQNGLLSIIENLVED